MAIRLQGLAAPEWNESGGNEARVAMIELVRGRTVRCDLDGTRTYDRCVAICHLDGQDVAAVLVQQGLARDCPRFSGGRYAQAERAAAAEGSTIDEVYTLPGTVGGAKRSAAPSSRAGRFLLSIRTVVPRRAGAPRKITRAPRCLLGSGHPLAVANAAAMVELALEHLVLVPGAGPRRCEWA
jgi:hypothetical protein